MTPPKATIQETLAIIESGSSQIALVVNEQNRLLGIVTDGDIRRALLKNISLQETIDQIMNVQPITILSTMHSDQALQLMKRNRVRHIPVVDENSEIQGIYYLEELVKPSLKDNWVVLMAGGLGRRLGDLTLNCPKPLIKVGAKPILETIIQQFIEHGFHRFYFIVNYKAEMIIDYFGDGSKWGVEIRYIHESKRMGTAGGLKLITEKLTQPIIVMNGDLLTKVNFCQLVQFHSELQMQATLCVRPYELQIPYGVVRVNEHRLVDIIEKPLHQFFVSAGIYVLEPDVMNYLPDDSFFDMPELFQQLIETEQEIAVFPIREYWIDVGKLEDLQRADEEYFKVFV
ncbi:nucleotidyltransferase family protein [Paenibacillus wynnii]|uniref:nucleotidyltransferase family protein n=1 Tax=Paenibacillus wynnii TaxID=268407 RepID=UPI0027908151|nr:nucleotidyltransferase family protein [Paenibacillus wynnii]MDQ0194833.1 dTDP-glucose pyrophosphorylase/predicted transcriptional regulator [Paenibacillus wynnii]